MTEQTTTAAHPDAVHDSTTVVSRPVERSMEGGQFPPPAIPPTTVANGTTGVDSSLAPGPAAPKAGRGPTRPTLVMADLLDDVVAADALGLVAKAFAGGTTSSALKAETKARKARLAALVKSENAAIETEERIAGFLATAEKLPAHLREMFTESVTKLTRAVPAAGAAS